MLIKARLYCGVLFVLIFLVACSTTGEEPAESTAVPEISATEVQSATPEPIATVESTATPEPTATPIPTETPLPTETPVPTDTLVPQGTVSGCAYWIDGSKVEVEVNLFDENFIERETQVATDGCYRISVPAGRWWVSSVHWNFGDCDVAEGCQAPRQLIDVPAGGVVEFDLYPLPPESG